MSDPPRAYRRTSGWSPGAQEVLDRFTERVEDYRATVALCDDDDTSIGTAVRSALFAAGRAPRRRAHRAADVGRGGRRGRR